MNIQTVKPITLKLKVNPARTNTEEQATTRQMEYWHKLFNHRSRLTINLTNYQRKPTIRTQEHVHGEFSWVRKSFVKYLLMVYLLFYISRIILLREKEKLSLFWMFFMLGTVFDAGNSWTIKLNDLVLTSSSSRPVISTTRGGWVAIDGKLLGIN